MPVTVLAQIKDEVPNEHIEYGYGSSDTAEVRIGTQVWIAKNLNVIRFANGDTIHEVRNNEDWKRGVFAKQPFWCHYDNDPANELLYGKLYNWWAVIDARGLAPRGWHVPSDAEWITLNKYLGRIAGAKTASTIKSVSGWNNMGNGNNSIRFSGFPAGIRHSFSGTFLDIGDYCGWWSSSEFSEGGAWYYFLYYFDTSLLRAHVDKGTGLSVRCIKD